MPRLHSHICRITALILAFSGIYNDSNAQSSTSGKLTLLFMGDIMGHDEQIRSAEDRSNHTYNYDSVFTYIKPVISEADIAIANLEVTMAGTPYRGYPSFSSPPALAIACRNAGIDCLVTANNHAADRRSSGINRTISILDSLGILHTGTFSDRTERRMKYPLILKKNGITVALLNYTYGTNGIKVKEPVIVNTIDKKVIADDIVKARNQRPDIIAVFLHWGKEYSAVPSKVQTELAEFIFEKGADIVIGSHPHTLQKMVWTKYSNQAKGRVAVYSLGNFISNHQKRKTNGGAIARIEIRRTGSKVSIYAADYYLTWVYSPVERLRKKFYIIPCSEYENRSSFFSEPVYYKKMKEFMVDSRSLLYNQNIDFYENIFNGSSWLSNY